MIYLLILNDLDAVEQRFSYNRHRLRQNIAAVAFDPYRYPV
jgi:hypothetical protein